MYSYVRALARTKGSNGTWNQVDISTMPLFQVYSQYSDIRAVLTNPVIVGELTVDFNDLPDTLRILTITFPQWLVSIGNMTLPTTTSIPSTSTTSVRHIDAWYWNFTVKPANHTKHPDAAMTYDDQVDLFIKKDGVDPLELQKYCIATVNGMTHRLSSSTLGSFIIGGCKAGRIAKDNKVGLLDFRELGETTTVSLSGDMLIMPVPDLPVSDAVYVDVKTPLLGKTIFLSFAGYFFALDDCYDVVGETVIKININRMDLLSRYYESRNYVDWSDTFVPLSPNGRLPDRVVKADFFTEQTIRNILDMPQSFVLAVDAEGVQVSYAALDDTQLAGVYIAYGEEPKVPVRVNLGRLPEYMAVKEIDQYVVKINGYQTGKPRRETVTASDLTVVENGDETPHAHPRSNAKLMYISKMQLT